MSINRNKMFRENYPEKDQFAQNQSGETQFVANQSLKGLTVEINDVENKASEQIDLELEKFEFGNFYLIDTDPEIKKRYVLLKRGDNSNDSIALLADYYEYKNQSKIIPPNHQTFQNQINEYISSEEFANIRSNDCNYRVAFIGGSPEHSVPIIYIKEGNKEAFLVACSKGMKSPAELLAEKTGIKCYYVSDYRQADKYSCHAEAVIFAKDATAKDPLTNEYRIPNLLSRLQEIDEKNGAKDQNPLVVETKLVDELLKTSQLSKFTDKHAEQNSTVIVHKCNKHSETREQFFNRYKKEGKNIYLHGKGIRLTSNIEIQYYVKQLKAKLGHLWTKDLHDKFIRDAKLELKRLGPIITGKESSFHQGPSRRSLHEFTKQFVNTLFPNISVKDVKQRVRRYSFD